MESYKNNHQEELKYLEETLAFIRSEMEKGIGALADRKGRLIAARKDMWEDTVHFTNDFNKLTEMNQYLTEVNNQTANYGNTVKTIEKYKKLIQSPYFGRFDFVENGSGEREKIYIGLNNVLDSKTHRIFVYDWRAPISSIFYRYELGDASYKAPMGTIQGSVALKRQYKIVNSDLKYFFDCSIRISDEILQEVLCRNSSVKMRNIVETVQKEQDIIIRDTDNDLLVVQGVAGSGKTSIALHRIAYLLYHGMNLKLNYNNILIISPNTVFSKYISSVLPELGEENVEQTTFQEIADQFLESKWKVETRLMQLESLITSPNHDEKNKRIKSMEFKGSREYVKILDRLIHYYEHHIISFEDIYFDGKIIKTRQQIKNQFLDNKIGLPMVKRLKKIENSILEQIHPMQRKRIEKIQRTVLELEGHEFEIKQFSRLLSMKESKVFTERMRKFTGVDALHVYSVLFNRDGLFEKLAHRMELPGGVEQIIAETKENLRSGRIMYEDSIPLLYLQLKLQGSDQFPEIRQVIVDEAQDYSPIHYEIFNLLFKDARFTVLGDVHQSIDKEVPVSLYDAVIEIFNKRKSVKLYLNKSYRASYEINQFTQKLLDGEQDFISFERHEAVPVIISKDTIKSMDEAVIEHIDLYRKQGYESIAIICKTAEQSEKLYGRVKGGQNIKLIVSNEDEIEKGVMIIPAYMAKGLEFDVVLVYNVSWDHYSNELDRRLLYIACTRALHRLAIYHTGKKSPLISPEA